MEQGIVCGFDREGTVVVPLSCDYGLWAERSARRAEDFTAFAKTNASIKKLALWVDEKISDRLAQELATRQIAIKTDILSNR